MTLRNPLSQKVQKLPSNVDVGTITIIVQRQMAWMDAEQRLGAEEMESYHQTASGINLAETIWKWCKATYPNARLVVSAEPGVDENGEPNNLPFYVGFSPDFPDEAATMKRIMHAVEDLMNNPEVWLVHKNSPTHVAIDKRHGGRGQSELKS